MTDWPAHLRLAATRLHIPPDVFWRLSVKDWAALTTAPTLDALGRKAFEALMMVHPDSPLPVDGGGAGGGGAPLADFTQRQPYPEPLSPPSPALPPSKGEGGALFP
jgi:uncharacterized phage protein (TIGR02216 family)